MLTDTALVPRKRGRKPKGAEALEQFTIRLSPSGKFAADVAATLTGGSLSQAIEWAMQSAMSHLPLRGGMTAWAAVEAAWTLYRINPTLVPFDERHACALIEQSEECREMNDEYEALINAAWPALLADASRFLIDTSAPFRLRDLLGRAASQPNMGDWLGP